MEFKIFSGYLKRLYSMLGIDLKKSVGKNLSPFFVLGDSATPGSNYSSYSKYCKDCRKNARVVLFRLTRCPC